MEYYSAIRKEVLPFLHNIMLNELFVRERQIHILSLIGRISKSQLIEIRSSWMLLTGRRVREIRRYC